MLWYKNLNKLLRYSHILNVSLVLYYAQYFESLIVIVSNTVISIKYSAQAEIYH